jgi:hypothetical protein
VDNSEYIPSSHVPFPLCKLVFWKYMERELCRRRESLGMVKSFSSPPGNLIG